MLDFLKKGDSASDGSQKQPQQPAQTAQTSQTVVKQETTQQVSGGASKPYSGIGNPPGGKAYNGIGNPPTPATPATQQTTTTTTQTAPNPEPAAPADTTVAPATPTPAAPQEKAEVEADKKQEADKLAADKQTAEKQSADKQMADKQTAEEKMDKNNKQAQLDLMTHLTQRSNRVFMAAQQKAKELGSDLIDSEHVLHGLLADPEIYKIFTEQKVQPQIIEQELEKTYKKGQSKKQPQPSPRVKKILENALLVARKIGYEFISPEHILLSVYDEGEGVGARTLAKLGIKKEDLNKKIIGKKEGLEAKDAKDGGKTTESVLQQFTNDLTEKAAQGQLDPVVERSDVIERLIHITSRRSKNNPALVGEAGVGKTAIVEGLAQKIIAKEVPESLLDKRILQLDLMSVIAGASHRGEFEERMKKIIEEITASDGKIVLFIDEIHNIVGAGAGGEGALDASNFLKPALARGELQVIGATTLTEYRKYVEKDPALERRFQPVLVPEPKPEQAIKMLKALRDKYEAFHKVKIPDDAIEAAVKLSKRYVGDRFLPDKAVDLIDEAGSAVRLPLISLPEKIRSLEERVKQLNQELEEAEKIGNKVQVSILKPKVEDLQAELDESKEEYETKKSQTTTSISEQSIKDIISRWTGIPVSKISDSEIEKLTKLEDIIHKRLINQNHAVKPVAEAIRRGRAGLKSNERPIGSFVFLGPTGVGKTELAKTLAEILFGQEEAMIRFDMTEYMEKHEVAKLLGAPPGYVGYEEGGKLTEAVRRRPYSVILFDEVEKAHPDIFNILLQILDDGRLTDNKGHVISFKNTVVINTSNIGTKMIQDDIMKDGKVDIEEPTVISSYTFSPRGRQILTIMGKVFERESADAEWKSKMLIDYFAGQKIENAPALPAGQENKDAAKDGENADAEKKPETPPAPANVEFPGKEFGTHAISPKGVEYISVGETLYERTSTTAKVWNAMSLIDYFKDGVVINALPDAPEQQLPTVKLKTHTFSPDEMEVVTYRDRFWKRKSADNNWETGKLKDYFQGHQLEGAESDPQNMDDEEGVGTKAKVADEAEKPSKDKKDAVAFPTNYWDIHGYGADGSEYIVVGEKVWVRAAQGTTWKMHTLGQYFGADFPLDKELEEKRKIEEELSKNQYDKTKTKVMQELRKFFRPELINRFDEVIIFEPLKYKHMLQIAELQLKGVKKLLEDQNMGFAWTEAAKKEIVRQGFDPIYGARPLRRAIQKLIENPISTLIIEKKLEENDMVTVDFDGTDLVFNIEKVKFVRADEVDEEGAGMKMKKFKCVDSQFVFETETNDHTTVICPINAKEKVEEVVEQAESPEPEKAENTQEVTKNDESEKKKEEEDSEKEMEDLEKELETVQNVLQDKMAEEPQKEEPQNQQPAAAA